MHDERRRGGRAASQLGGSRRLWRAVVWSVLTACLPAACGDDEDNGGPPPVIGPDPVTVAPLIASAADEFAPVWSPDGSRLAFCRGVGGLDLHIFVQELGSGSETQVSDLPAANECFASWSPDGTQLVFDDNLNIYIAPATGDSTTPFTHTIDQELFAAWSPDGEWIAFSANVGDLGLPQFDLFMRSVDPDTSGAHSVIRLTATLPDESEPAWSPDGELIAFRAGPPQGGNIDIGILSLADSTFAPRQITGHGAADVNPEFSPDGRYLTWTSLRSGNAELWVIDLEAEDPVAVQVTRNSGIDSNPSWSPDGERIAFATTRSGSWDIYVASDLDSVLAASAGGAP